MKQIINIAMGRIDYDVIVGGGSTITMLRERKQPENHKIVLNFDAE